MFRKLLKIVSIFRRHDNFDNKEQSHRGIELLGVGVLTSGKGFCFKILYS